MKPFLIVLGALWIYPILSLFIMLPLRERPKARKVFLIIFAIPALIATIGFFSGYSTVNENTDWYFVSSIYFFICLLIWRLALHSRTWIKVIGILFAVITFGVAYFNASVGVLGIAFVMSEYEHEGKIALTDNLSYTENVIGNATSDYRGKRIEIFSSPQTFSFLEHSVYERSYTDIQQFAHPVKAVYDSTENAVIFSIPKQRKGKYRMKGWSDTVDLDLYIK